MNRRHFIHAGLGVSLGSTLIAALKQDRLEEAEKALAKAAKTGQVHAAALFVRQGEQIFSRSFGAAADSLDSMFLLASITKPICISAVMTLYDQRQFSLDDPVANSSRNSPETAAKRSSCAN